MTDDGEVIDGEAVLESDEPVKRKGTSRKGAKHPGKAGSRGRNAAGHPRRIAAEVKAQKGLQARLEGKTWNDVAKAAGYRSPGAAHDAVMGHLAHNPPASDAREALRFIMDGQIDEVIGRFLPAAILEGDHEAARVVERFLNRRARLHGLDTTPDTGLVPMDSVQGLIDLVLNLTTRFVPEAKRPAWLEAVDTATKQLTPPDR